MDAIKRRKLLLDFCKGNKALLNMLEEGVTEVIRPAGYTDDELLPMVIEVTTAFMASCTTLIRRLEFDEEKAINEIHRATIQDLLSLRQAKKEDKKD